MRTILLSAIAVFSAACAPTDTDPLTSTTLELEVGAYRFNAVTSGPEDGELVLLLHGFPQTSYSLRSQRLALAAAGYRAVAIDQRGYSPGARPADVEAYAMPRLVEDIAGVADALGSEHFHVVGHDWGAAVAWFTAMTYPDRVLSVTALSVPHPFAFSQAAADPEGDQAKRSSYMTTFRAPGAEDKLLANDAKGLRAIYSDGLEEQAVEAYVDVLGTPEALGAALNWYRAMGASVPYAPLTPIRMPALYIWSTNDPSMSREGAELTETFIEGPYRFEVLEGVSHWIPEEAAERVNELLVEHLGAAMSDD